MKRVVTALVVFSVVLLGQASSPSAQNARKAPNDVAQSRVNAARRTFELLTGAAPKGGTGAASDLEKLYFWSRRWMEAERDLSDKKNDRIAATEAHLQRMKKLGQQIQEQNRAGLATNTELSAAEYFRLEGEMWLTQAKQ